jgi:hypothetical protein
MALDDLQRAVSCVAVTHVPALEHEARAAGTTVIHVDAGTATDRPTLLAAIAQGLGLGDAGGRWNWSAITDLLWQRIQQGGATLLVLDRIDALLEEDLQLVLDTAAIFRDLERSVAPTPFVTVLSGTGRRFPHHQP